jgi:hypothetical protein
MIGGFFNNPLSYYSPLPSWAMNLFGNRLVASEGGIT